MAIKNYELIAYGSNTMPDNDTTTEIGGAIDTSIRVVFTDPAATGEVEAVSESAADTSQTVTVYGRRAAGSIVTDEISLNGQTPAQAGSANSFERLMKAEISAAHTGAVAVMTTTNTTTGTAQSGGNDTIKLAAGASAVDDAYKDEIIRTTGGTGSNQIRRIISYNGTTKDATVWPWTGDNPSSDTTYEIAPGIFFDKVPNEVTEVRRVCYDAAAPESGESDIDYYEKIFVSNESQESPAKDFSNAKVSEVAAGAYENVTFALETTVDGSGTNGAGNARTVAPTSGVGAFNSAEKDMANSGVLEPDSAQGIWIELTLADDDSSTNTYWSFKSRGQSV
jgi:hypothetical protein